MLYNTFTQPSNSIYTLNLLVGYTLFFTEYYNVEKLMVYPHNVFSFQKQNDSSIVAPNSPPTWTSITIIQTFLI